MTKSTFNTTYCKESLILELSGAYFSSFAFCSQPVHKIANLPESVFVLLSNTGITHFKFWLWLIQVSTFLKYETAVRITAKAPKPVPVGILYKYALNKSHT